MESVSFEDFLATADLGIYNDCFQSLKQSLYGQAFYHALRTLKRDHLYQSHIHGEKHIERVLLFAALLAKDNGLSAEDTSLLFDACSYHDVGRIDDSKDDEHGARSALKIAELTGRTGVDLDILKAAVTAHAPADSCMHTILRDYQLDESKRAKTIADYLKDADALDRVRVQDLNPSFLRNPHSHTYVDLAYLLYSLY